MHVVITYDGSPDGNYIYFVEDNNVSQTRDSLIDREFEELTTTNFKYECNIGMLSDSRRCFYICKVDTDFYNKENRVEIEAKIKELEEELTKYID